MRRPGVNAFGVPGFEGEQHKRRRHGARQRIDDQEQLVERLGDRERRQRRNRLGTPLGRKDPADEPGHEVVAVVRRDVADVGHLKPRQVGGGGGGVELRVLLSEEVAEDEDGVDRRHREDAGLQKRERRRAREQPARGHARADDQRQPADLAERVVGRDQRRGQDRHDENRHPRSCAVGRPAQRDRAAGRHQQQSEPREDVRARRCQGDRHDRRKDRQRRHQRPAPATEPRQQRRQPRRRERNAERLGRVEHRGVGLEVHRQQRCKRRATRGGIVAAWDRGSESSGGGWPSSPWSPCRSGSRRAAIGPTTRSSPSRCSRSRAPGARTSSGSPPTAAASRSSVRGRGTAGTSWCRTWGCAIPRSATTQTPGSTTSWRSWSPRSTGSRATRPATPRRNTWRPR